MVGLQRRVNQEKCERKKRLWRDVMLELFYVVSQPSQP